MTAPEFVTSTVRVFFAPIAHMRQRERALGTRAFQYRCHEMGDLSSSARFGDATLVFLIEIALAAIMFAVMAACIALLGVLVGRLDFMSPTMAQVFKVIQYAVVSLAALLFVNIAIRALIQLIRPASTASPTSEGAA